MTPVHRVAVGYEARQSSRSLESGEHVVGGQEALAERVSLLATRVPTAQAVWLAGQAAGVCSPVLLRGGHSACVLVKQEERPGSLPPGAQERNLRR